MLRRRLLATNILASSPPPPTCLLPLLCKIGLPGNRKFCGRVSVLSSLYVIDDLNQSTPVCGKLCHHKKCHIVVFAFVFCVYFLLEEGGVLVGTGWFNFESPHCSNFWATITIIVTTDVSIVTIISLNWLHLQAYTVSRCSMHIAHISHHRHHQFLQVSALWQCSKLFGNIERWAKSFGKVSY